MDVFALTANQIRYLLLIRELERIRSPVRSVELANRLGVSRASVHKALESFGGTNCISKERYSTVVLTAEGARLADECLRRYRDIEKHLSPLIMPVSTYSREICGLVRMYREDHHVQNDCNC